MLTHCRRARLLAYRVVSLQSSGRIQPGVAAAYRIAVTKLDQDSAEVLMVGFMNEQALAETRRTGFATFFSRTRGKLWMKGETSGNRLEVQAILVDCDDDTVLVKVKRLGGGNVCHTGERTCFFRALES